MMCVHTEARIPCGIKILHHKKIEFNLKPIMCAMIRVLCAVQICFEVIDGILPRFKRRSDTSDLVDVRSSTDTLPQW